MASGARPGRRPAVWALGGHLVIDWGVIAGVHVFCAVLAWSRWRFVRLAADEKQATTLALLAECFEALGGVPKVVLADRMGCLKGGVVANRVVPTSDYVRFASHYRFRPDFREAADPEEVLRTLIEAEVAARDASNERARLKAATFPVVKPIEQFDLTASSIPAPTWAYLTSLEWISAKENLALIGPAGTGKTHALIAGLSISSVRFAGSWRSGGRRARGPQSRGATRSRLGYG